MKYENIIFQKKDGVASITLNRPEKLNAQNGTSLAELKYALEDAENDESIGVIAIRGAGRGFCAGMDMTMSFGADAASQVEKIGGMDSYTRFWHVCNTIEAMSKPVISVVHGYAVTGGFLLAYTSDLVVAADNAIFMDTHSRYGIIPAAGETQRLPRRIGLIKAKELFFTCDRIDANEALRIGLVNKVVPADELETTVKELTDKILKNSRKSIGVFKRLINDGGRSDFEKGLKQEWEISKGGMANIEGSDDRNERLKAFNK
jgi:enoyl-CoA hydratase/carnithine racemase